MHMMTSISKNFQIKLDNAEQTFLVCQSKVKNYNSSETNGFDFVEGRV